MAKIRKNSDGNDKKIFSIFVNLNFYESIKNMTDLIEEMKSPFEELKQTDASGREWWNSRKLAHLLGYDKYWNFERLIEKVAIYLQHN